MEVAAYNELATREIEGWYYCARRRMIADLLEKHLTKTETPQILDVGCGTGGSSAWLQSYGQVVGIDSSDLALSLARQNYPSLATMKIDLNTAQGSIFAERFDVIIILGVLYHRSIVSPAHVLKALSHWLRPSGIIVWNDATYQSLQRPHDEFVHGGRRFSPQSMKAMLEQHSLTVIHSSPLLCWAFPIAWLQAKLGKTSVEHSQDDQALPRSLELLLQMISYWEWRLTSLLKVPGGGVNQLLVAQKASEKSAI
jgi:SAM-dependent methyltransferase